MKNCFEKLFLKINQATWHQLVFLLSRGKSFEFFIRLLWVLVSFGIRSRKMFGFLYASLDVSRIDNKQYIREFIGLKWLWIYDALPLLLHSKALTTGDQRLIDFSETLIIMLTLPIIPVFLLFYIINRWEKKFRSLKDRMILNNELYINKIFQRNNLENVQRFHNY